MICIDCGNNVIGSIPNILYNSKRCHACYQIYAGQQQEEDKKEKIEEKIEQEKEEEKDDPIVDRFDILDL